MQDGMGILDQELSSMTQSASSLYQHSIGPRCLTILKAPDMGTPVNSVGGIQIISIGGVDSNSNINGGSGVIRSTFDSQPDPFAQGLAIFDMTTLRFVNQYTAEAPPYEQSDKVKQFYAQSQG